MVHLGDPTARSIDKTTPIYTQTAYYLDNTNSLTLVDAIAQKDTFINVKSIDDMPWDWTQRTWWMHITLTNKGPLTYPLVAHFDNPMLDELDVFLLEGEQVTQSSALGDTREGLNKDLKTLPHFSFDMPQSGEISLLIRIKTTGLAKTPVSIYLKPDFWHLKQQINLIWGLFLGVLFLIAVYNLVLYHGIKDRVYLVYIGYILSVIAMTGVVNGFGHYVWPAHIQSWLHHQVVFTNYAVATCIMAFTVMFLRYQQDKSKLFYLGTGYFGVMVCLMLASLLMPEFVAAQIFFVVMFFLYIICFTLILNKVFTGFRWAKFYIISWLPLIIGGAVQPMMLMGLVPHNFITRHAFMIGTLLEITLMAMALADRMRHLKAQTLFHATHDQDTGLPNFTLLVSRMKQLIEARRPFSLCLIEVRNYGQLTPYIHSDQQAKLLSEVIKHINKLIMGDAHYRYLENRIDRKHKIAKAREGVLALVSVPFINEEHFEQQVAFILSSLPKKVSLDGLEVHINSAVGCCYSGKEPQPTERIIKNAFQALELAKSRPTQFAMYHDDQNAIAEKHRIAVALSRAIERNEFELYYQPQIDLANRKVHGAEVLIRWHHPELGLVMPDDFISIAEDLGLINKITHFVINQALADLHELVELGHRAHRMSINISGVDINQLNFVADVQNAIYRHHVPAHLITLELTESVMVHDYSALRQSMTELADMGINLAIDDFGTGYSSFSHIMELPFNEVKLDKQFILPLSHAERTIKVVKAAIEMTRSLGLKVVAEGVETKYAQATLRSLHCHIGQGYYYAKPMTFKAYQAWLIDYQKVLTKSNDPNADL